MPEQTITMTQNELDELIAKRVARVRAEYEDNGQRSWKRHARQWEDRCKMAHQETEIWRSRAKFNQANNVLLKEQIADLLDRLGRRAA